MTDGAIPFTTGVILATALAIFFSYVAGIRSVMWTDSLQAIMMIVVSTLVALLVGHELGGFATLIDTLSIDHPDSLVVPGDGLFSFVTFLGLTIPWFFFSLSNPQVSQRLFMPSSLRALRQMLLGFLVFGFVYAGVGVVGLLRTGGAGLRGAGTGPHRRAVGSRIVRARGHRSDDHRRPLLEARHGNRGAGQHCRRGTVRALRLCTGKLSAVIARRCLGHSRRHAAFRRREPNDSRTGRDRRSVHA